MRIITVTVNDVKSVYDAFIVEMCVCDAFIVEIEEVFQEILSCSALKRHGYKNEKVHG